MYIKHNRRSAFTLVEVLVFVVLTALVVGAGAILAHNFMRTVAFLTNTVDLDTKSRLAVDRVSREIRNCEAIQAATSNSIVLRLGTNLTTYVHDPARKEKPLLRLSPDHVGEETILTGCDYVRFDLFKRNPTSGPQDKYDYYPPAANVSECKIVQVNWVCSRYLLGFKANTTTMQSAKVVIRKQ
ncbi:MAG TPA: prepilin-type N-terminal cleavage/methylation domain-containing protein [Verrucomicrobiae bacterium]|nr:prepilin-type N-terminal cleavage/methylation domain-containing protein [Verrucomicrobiae bacterium]